MNYETAKKLKDAGFKYSNSLHRAYKPDGTFRTLGDTEDEEYIYEPTLSELVEACSDRFRWLGKEQQGWTAQATGVTGEDKIRSKDIKVKGSTPEIAVANLWLALNTK